MTRNGLGIVVKNKNVLYYKYKIANDDVQTIFTEPNR